MNLCLLMSIDTINVFIFLCRSHQHLPYLCLTLTLLYVFLHASKLHFQNLYCSWFCELPSNLHLTEHIPLLINMLYFYHTTYYYLINVNKLITMLYFYHTTYYYLINVNKLIKMLYFYHTTNYHLINVIKLINMLFFYHTTYYHLINVNKLINMLYFIIGRTGSKATHFDL